MSPLSPPCSYIPKEKSPHSISSLDENEIDEVRKKLDHLQSLLIQTTAKNTEENGEKIDDSCQNLPNYATFSVKQSHEYAVRNWLLSNFNHI
ncbi:unnamed protein product [Schistosoma mattheei]|uniref:Uncharacterized protein n=1 Tax=Schistosoma mattheei TaxID=31246 RepID=A0AA85BTQ0_9TREM|nr:unnamed protein product [Schistosoma mattheei]